MKWSLNISCVALLVALVHASDALPAEKVVIVSKGGAYQDAQRRAYFAPFTKETGIEVVEVSGVDFPRIKTAVMANNVPYDVIDASAHDHDAMKRAGMLQKFDYGVLAKEDADAIDPKLRDDYGVPNVIWSMILAYNAKMYPQPPRDWADFWDVKKYPGLRASQDVRFPPLEQAAFAMGAKGDDVYKLGLDNMLRKIKELGSNLTFKTTPEMVHLLATGEIGMAVTSNGRIKALAEDGRPIAIQWNQGVMNLVYFVVPKGAPNPKNALKLIAFMSRPEPQAQLAKEVYFGPVNANAYKYLDAGTRRYLSNDPSNTGGQIMLDANWWGENRERMVKEWNRVILGR